VDKNKRGMEPGKAVWWYSNASRFWSEIITQGSSGEPLEMFFRLIKIYICRSTTLQENVMEVLHNLNLLYISFLVFPPFILANASLIMAFHLFSS
jgi:hypothetical protein